jgi:hypothetical protein
VLTDPDSGLGPAVQSDPDSGLGPAVQSDSSAYFDLAEHSAPA